MEKKKPHDMTTDGVLAYGVNVGRLVFNEARKTVYCVSDLPHIGASDAFTVYQISKADYDKLLALSLPNRIPSPAVSAKVTDACHQRFLCGESAHQARYECTLDDIDQSLTDAF